MASDRFSPWADNLAALAAPQLGPHDTQVILSYLDLDIADDARTLSALVSAQVARDRAHTALRAALVADLARLAETKPAPARLAALRLAARLAKPARMGGVA